MAFRFKFEVDGAVQFDRAFLRVQERIEDLRPVWDGVEREFHAIEREQFESEGSAGRSGKWAPLSRKYAEQKEKKYPGAQILERTGALKRSLTSETEHSTVTKEKQEFAIGTSLPYAKYHQRGGKHLPQREIISFSDTQRTRLMKEIQKGLLQIIRGDRTVTQTMDVIG